MSIYSTSANKPFVMTPFGSCQSCGSPTQSRTLYYYSYITYYIIAYTILYSAIIIYYTIITYTILYGMFTRWAGCFFPDCGFRSEIAAVVLKVVSLSWRSNMPSQKHSNVMSELLADDLYPNRFEVFVRKVLEGVSDRRHPEFSLCHTRLQYMRIVYYMGHPCVQRVSPLTELEGFSDRGTLSFGSLFRCCPRTISD